MSTYRVEWDCCGGVSETEAYEPDRCPFCDTTAISEAVAAERERSAKVCEDYAWLQEEGSTARSNFRNCAATIRRA